MSSELAKQGHGQPISGFEIEMGAKVAQNMLDKYSVKEGQRDLITVLTKKPVVTRTMYHDDIGFSFHAIPEAEGKPYYLDARVHYNFLVIVWNSDKAGKSIIDNTYDIKLLKVAQAVYDRLCTKFELNGDLSKLVMQVSVEKGKEQFQPLMFEVHNTIKPPFLKDKALFEEIKESFTRMKGAITKSVAGHLSFDEFQSKMAEAGKGPAPESDKQFANAGRAVEQASSVDNEIEDVSFEEVDESTKKEAAPAKQLKEAPAEKEVKKEEEAKEEATDKSGEFFSEEDVNFE